jgi:hypothetical protein
MIWPAMNADDIHGRDVGDLLQDFGQTIITPTGNGLVLVDVEHTPSGDGRTIRQLWMLTGLRELIEPLKVGDALQVGEIAHTVERPPMAAGDGALWCVLARRN